MAAATANTTLTGTPGSEWRLQAASTSPSPQNLGLPHRARKARALKPARTENKSYGSCDSARAEQVTDHSTRGMHCGGALNHTRTRVANTPLRRTGLTIGQTVFTVSMLKYLCLKKITRSSCSIKMLDSFTYLKQIIKTFLCTFQNFSSEHSPLNNNRTISVHEIGRITETGEAAFEKDIITRGAVTDGGLPRGHVPTLKLRALASQKFPSITCA